MVEVNRAICAIVAIVLIAAMAFLAHGCGVLFKGDKQAERAQEGVAVPVTRIPVEREALPLPEYPESFSVVADYATNETSETLATKKELAALVAEIEQIKAKTAEEIYRLMQTARQDLQDAQKQKDVELAALEDKLHQETAVVMEQARAKTYETGKWLWAIIAAAIACVVYCYKRLNAAAAVLGLIGFVCLFALVLAGQHYPQIVALAPVPFIALLTYIAYRDGLISKALTACVRGIELADDDKTKRAVRKQDKARAIERTARRDIDKATVELALERHEAATEKRREENNNGKAE